MLIFRAPHRPFQRSLVQRCRRPATPVKCFSIQRTHPGRTCTPARRRILGHSSGAAQRMNRLHRHRRQFGYYSASGSTIVGHTLVAGDIPALSYQLPLTFTGTGARTASSTGSLVSGDCAKWDPNGNIIDFGAPCASVATGAAGQFAFYSAAGSALTAHTLGRAISRLELSSKADIHR